MDMQAKIGYPYLSDLPCYKRAVWFEMKRLCLSDYPKKQLEDFSRYASIFISFLYFGQYSGNFTRTVSSYTFVLVFPPQIGQWIQREFFRLSFTLYTSNNGIAPRWTSGFCLFIVYSKRANGLQFLIVHQLCDCMSGSLITIFSYCSSMFCI